MHKFAPPKVVIIGAGFGGIAAAKALKKAPVQIEIIDKRNYHLFQPLLYQVATADLSPADIAWPIRGIFSSQKNVTVTLSKVLTVDTEKQKVICDATEVSYDYLIIANGSSHSYFGNDHWEEHAPGLKRIIDATEIRKRVLMGFERAELCANPEDQKRELTFAIVGAGPTGVETAGAIAELAHVTLTEDFRRIKPDQAKIILIEGGPRILSAFPESLSAKAHKSLQQLGVEVLTNVRVEDVAKDYVIANGEKIPTATTIWAAGVKISDLGDWLGVETDRIGRVAVESNLSVKDHPNIFVIGDAAKVAWKDNIDVPGIAPAAKQEGRYVGKLIAGELNNAKAPAAFKYRHMGSLATVGRNSAIIDFGHGIKLSGRIAWWLWGVAHIYFLIGVKRPLFVAMSWFSNYVFRSKGARLITGIKTRDRKPSNPQAQSESNSRPVSENTEPQTHGTS